MYVKNVTGKSLIKCFKLNKLFYGNSGIYRLLFNCSQRKPLRSVKIPGMQNILNWRQQWIGLPLLCLQFCCLLTVCVYISFCN